MAPNNDLRGEKLQPLHMLSEKPTGEMQKKCLKRLIFTKYFYE